jgi:hypothetical protein
MEVMGPWCTFRVNPPGLSGGLGIAECGVRKRTWDNGMNYLNTWIPRIIQCTT